MTVTGAGFDRLVTEKFFLGNVEALVDGVLEDLSVKEFGDLPERDLKVKAGTVDMFEYSPTPVIDAGDVAGRNGDEKATDYFIH